MANGWLQQHQVAELLQSGVPCIPAGDCRSTWQKVCCSSVHLPEVCSAGVFDFQLILKGPNKGSLHCVYSLRVQTNGKVANDNGHSEVCTGN